MHYAPWPPSSKSSTLLTRTFTTPKNPWSRRLNLRWSNICTATTDESLTILDTGVRWAREDTDRTLDEHIEALVPVGVESLLDHARCVGLFCINSNDSERIGKPEDIAFGKAIRGDD